MKTLSHLKSILVITALFFMFSISPAIAEEASKCWDAFQFCYASSCGYTPLTFSCVMGYIWCVIYIEGKS